MRVITRIAAAYGVLIVLMASGLTYQLVLIHRLQSSATRVAAVHLRVAATALDVSAEISRTTELATSYFVAGYPFYREGLVASIEAVSRLLQDLRRVSPGSEEQQEIDRLSAMWGEFAAAVSRAESRRQPGKEEALPDELQGWLKRAAESGQRIYTVAQSAADAETQRAEAYGDEAWGVAWIAAAAAIGLSGVVLVGVLRSTSSSLHRLAAGTRAVSREQFAHRIRLEGTDEFSELAADFNRMAVRLGQLEQLKKDFVSHVSHDLKSPLASTREMLHLLEQKIPGPLTAKQERLVHLCDRNLETLTSMVANLLDVARIEAGSMTFAPAPGDLVSIVRESVQEFESRSQEKGVTVVFTAGAGMHEVVVDRERLKQAIRNLIENAIKFSPTGSTVDVTIESGQHSRLVIADRGPGVPDEHKRRIFEKFHQVKPGGKIAGQGVGLGLAICRAIVEGHGGKIWVDDRPGGGSMFVVSLPSR